MACHRIQQSIERYSQFFRYIARLIGKADINGALQILLLLLLILYRLMVVKIIIVFCSVYIYT